MHTTAQALAEILREARPLCPSLHPLSEALGLVLAEDVVSDVDSPPFDKALMDGFAVRSADLALTPGPSPSGRGERGERTAALTLIEEVTAGRVPSRSVGPGETIRMMTGAPLPDGADAVVPIEETQFDERSGSVQIAAAAIEPGTNVLRRGTSLQRGECVVPAGRLLRPQELGALAELGRAEVPVRRQPRIAVLATGDELVPVGETPGPGQIHNSNETMLTAQIRRAGGEPVPLGIARDNRNDLRQGIQAGLECDVLLLSGGVSVGKLDLVPSELEGAGVREVFHKVRVKPGKPLWFGIGDANLSLERCYVFGLPGNPVSSMVCFELFVRSAIRRLMGVEPAEPQPVSARLTQEHLAKGDRPTYYPARLEWTDTGPTVRPVRWHGSSDLRATVDANAMALFPAGDKRYLPGERIDVFVW